MRTLLTIAIPTHNRSQCLDRALSIALPQIKPYAGKVQLYVSDNASTDNTQNVIAKHQARYPDILISKRQATNIGGAANFEDAVRSVDSKFVALMGDDDIILPHYVEDTLNILETYPQIGLLNFNEIMTNQSNERCTGLMNPIFNIGSILYYPNGSDFISTHMVIPSHVSSNVFNRSLFLNTLEDSDVIEYAQGKTGFEWFLTLYKGILTCPCIYCSIPHTVYTARAVKEWDSDGPWYFHFGWGRMFEILEKDIPGIYVKWMSLYRAMPDTHRNNFKLMCQYRSLYRKRYAAMKQYSPSWHFSLMHFATVYLCCPAIVTKFFCLLHALYLRLTVKPL